jgi:SAM-dependent methyltransferase
MQDPNVIAAEAYESLFVPALFGAWAPKLADAAALAEGDRVLDIACGTGVVAREAIRRCGATGSVAGLDLGAGMIAVARRLAPGVDFREGNALALPWPDAEFDAVVCQFGLMFFGDRERAVGEMARVLRPGGRLAVAVWAAIEANTAYAAQAALVERIAGAAAAQPLRSPYALADTVELSRLLASQGLSSIEIVTQTSQARFPSVRAMVEADVCGWLPLMGVTLADATVEAIMSEAEVAFARYVAADGSMRFEVAAHIATARSPAERTPAR